MGAAYGVHQGAQKRIKIQYLLAETSAYKLATTGARKHKSSAKNLTPLTGVESPEQLLERYGALFCAIRALPKKEAKALMPDLIETRAALLGQRPKASWWTHVYEMAKPFAEFGAGMVLGKSVVKTYD